MAASINPYTFHSSTSTLNCMMVAWSFSLPLSSAATREDMLA
jgi:hypothetical protein